MHTMLQLLRRRSAFRRLWLAEVVSMLGDWLSLVAISVVAMDRGEGPLAIAWVFVAHALPTALMAPLAGPVADRFDRRHVLAASYLLSGVVTLGMLGAALAGSVLVLTGLVWARASLSAFAQPARSAALKSLVEPEELLIANALDAGTWSVMFALGMALGGLLTALSPALALGLDALTFLLAVLLARGLPALTPPRAAAALASTRRSLMGPFAQLRLAFRHAAARPPLLRALLAKVPVALAGGGAWVAMNLRAEEPSPLGSVAVTLGLLQAVRGAGAGVGPVASQSLVARGLRPEPLWRGSQLLAFVAIAGLALAGGWAVVFVAVALWGLGVGANWVFSTAELQRRSPDTLIGRLSALDSLLFTSAMCVSALLGGWLIDVSGSVGLAVLPGLGLGVLAWVLVPVLARAARATSSRRPDEHAGATPREFDAPDAVSFGA